MTGTPERAELQPDLINQIPPETEIPPEVERVPGMTPPQNQQQSSQTMTSSPQMLYQPQDQTPTQDPTVQVKQTDEELKVMSKGPIEDSSTWLGVTLVRMIKKALHFGWKLIRGE